MLDGIAPKEMAPNLCSITRYKSRSVSTELENNNWIKSINKMLVERDCRGIE
jgi:hypothetical protein